VPPAFVADLDTDNYAALFGHIGAILALGEVFSAHPLLDATALVLALPDCSRTTNYEGMSRNNSKEHIPAPQQEPAPCQTRAYLRGGHTNSKLLRRRRVHQWSLARHHDHDLSRVDTVVRMVR
jgi:hypothetical protein